MTFSQLFVMVVVLLPLTFMARGKLRIDITALLIAVLLGLAQYLGMGVLGPAHTPRNAAKAIAGLSQPVVITLFSLFIVTRCLERTGVTRWVARRVLEMGGQSERRLILLFTTTTALLSLFMNNLAAGALMLPSAMDVSRRTKIRPSKLLMPVSYGSLLGGVATYFTTANIIVSDLLLSADPPQSPLHILDFTPTGGLIAVSGILFIGLFAHRLLPNHTPQFEQVMARRTGSELEDVYHLDERLWEARVPEGSPIIGRTLAEIGIGSRLGLAVAAIWRDHESIFAPSPTQVLHLNDVLLTIGREERVSKLVEEGFKVGRDPHNGHISERGVAFVEVLLAPRSSAEGYTLKELEFRKKYGFTGVALLREGQSHRTDVADIKLKMGDSILMVGDWDRLKGLQMDRSYIVLEPDPSDQPLNVRHARLAVGVIGIAITASIVGVPVYLAMLAAAISIFLLGLLTVEDAYRSMEWQALFLIAGMYSVSLAMVNTGLAEIVGQRVVDLVAPFGPLGLAAGSFLLTAALTQIMGGQVTALVTGPIAISAAIQIQTSPQAMAVAAAIGCSVSLTPLAHPVNILMIGPGNYSFGDFFRLGWRLTVVCFIALMAGMVLFWDL